MKEQTSYQQFSELTNAELNQVVGGMHWWEYLFNPHQYQYLTEGTKPKIG